MKYAIAAGHTDTARAAEEIFRAGGNAVDAAIAAFLMSWVAEPCMSSAGGGGFAMVRMANRAPVLLDFFCQTPVHKIPEADMDFFPVTVDFGDTREVFHVGRASTGVPGSVDGVFRLYERYGSLPLRELFRPAIEAAKSGLVVNNFQALDFLLLEPILAIDPEAQPYFFANDRLIRAGELLRLPQMADYLDYLWREGRDAFYRGEIARKIVGDYRQGGHLRRTDLERYESVWRDPALIHYRDHLVATNPSPSMGGKRLDMFLKALATGKRSADPLDAGHARQLMEAFRQIRTAGGFGLHGSTTHFSLADREGNAVSLTASNGEGCGYFVEGTNIQLNNMMGEAALLPDGFHSWKPDTRLASMMVPTMVFSEAGHRLELVTGSSGAGRIPYAIAQVIHYALDYGLHVREAVNFPRLHWQAGHWDLEPGFAVENLRKDTPEPIRAWEAFSLYFGGVNTVKLHAGELEAASDDRREGAAVVG